MVERAIGDEILTAGEKRVFAAVKEAMTVWLDTARALVLRTELPAKARTILDSSLTAAGEDEYVPDPDDIQASFPVWEAMLTDEILPTVALSFGEGFLASSRAADISAIAHQERHLEEVFDRLKIWPVGAFEELRPELLESLANGESIDQTRDRIGRVLSIDAPSQRIRADISDVDRRLADPDTPRSDLVSLRAERRRLWNSHDEALQEWQWKARRIARTEVQGAVEGGSQAAAAEIAAVTGEQMYKQWLATSDERTRRSHSVADGQIVRIEDKFRVGGSSLDHPADPRGRDKEIINCVTGDALLAWPGDHVVNATRRRQEGTFVHLHTIDGHDLTVTPNHPVLTLRGYVPAGFLEPGQQLIATCIPVTPEIQDGPPRADETFRAARMNGVGQRVVGSGVQFHGDPSAGAEVEIVWTDGELWEQDEIASRGSFHDPRFFRLHDAQSSGAGSGGSMGGLASGSVPRSDPRAGSVGSPGNVGGSCEVPAFVVGEPGHTDPVSFGPGSGREGKLVKAAHDCGTRDPETLAHLQDADSLGMQLSEISHIDLFTGSHEVYNLTTGREWYTANGIALHNCRCTTRILDQSEVDDELGGKWGNLGVRPMSARMGPDPDESIDAAIGALAAEQRGEKAEWPKPVAPPAPKKAKAKNEFAGRSLDSLQNDMIRMVEDPNMDEATFTRLADEIDRREIKNAAARAQRATQRAAIRATQEDEYFRLTEGGMDDLEATSKAFGIPLDRLKRQRATEWLRAQGAQGKSLPALIKDYHLDIVLEETMRAEAATNGVMFKRQFLGKGGTYPFSSENLWRMPDDKAREYASEELLAHWDQFGRTTQEQIKANAMNDFDSLRNIRSASRDFNA